MLFTKKVISMEKPVLLIVDDEPDIRMICSSIIERSFQLRVVKVGSFTEALKMIKAHAPAYALLDVNLPDGSGFDLVPKLIEANENVRYSFITAHSQFKEREKAKELGANFLIAKPFKSCDINLSLQAMMESDPV
jgi:CheY-like chemotaxis protein